MMSIHASRTLNVEGPMATLERDATPDVATARRYLREASGALDQALCCLTESVRYDSERMRTEKAFRLVHDVFMDLDERESDGGLIGKRHE